jgi:hypothetical protein
VDDREMADLIEDAFEHIPRHRGCGPDGLLAAVRSGVIDFIDALTLASVILGENGEVPDAMKAYDKRRFEHLNSKVGECEDDGERI